MRISGPVPCAGPKSNSAGSWLSLNWGSWTYLELGESDHMSLTIRGGASWLVDGRYLFEMPGPGDFVIRFSLFALTCGREGGGRFCPPPLMFFADIQQTNGLIFTSFSVPDQKWAAHLLKKEIENRFINFELEGCIVKLWSARARRCVSGHLAQTSVWIIFRSCKIKRRSETGEPAFESTHQGTPNPCLTF